MPNKTLFEYYSDKRSLVVLGETKGFPMELRPPRTDRIAKHHAKHHFGDETVENILSVLHRSQLNYEDLMTDFLEYDQVYTPHLRDDPVYQMVFQSVREEWLAGDQLIPLTLGGVAKHPDMPGGKSPGLPWKMLGYKSKREVAEDPKAMNQIGSLWQHVGAGRNTELPDCCLFARAQITTRDKNKIRSTWGYPMDVYLEEGRFFYPLIAQVKTTELNIPIGYQVEMSTGGMAHIASMISKNKGATFKICDWSKFDKHVPPWLIRDVFSILREKFVMDKVKDAEGKIWNVRPDRSERRWRKIVNYFINTPVRTCKGARFMKQGGIPSGSCFTNIIDSIVNQVMQRYIVYQTTGTMPLAEIYLGDDSVTAEIGAVNLDDQAKLAHDKFGAELNVRKSYVTSNPRNVHFLGYYNYDGSPLKAQDFSIASFIFPEHTVKEPVVTAARALGQLWCSFDPEWAGRWLKLIQDICIEYGFKQESIEMEMRDRPYRYKFLAQTGVDPRAVVMPTVDNRGLVWAVCPSSTPRKPWRRKDWNLERTWRETKEYWKGRTFEHELGDMEHAETEEVLDHDAYPDAYNDLE